MKLIVRRAKAFLKFLCIYSNSSISNTRISLIWENNKACILLMESVIRGKLYPSFPFLFCGKANYTFWFAYKVNWFYDTTPLVSDLRYVCLLGVWHLEPPKIWCNYDCCHKYSNVITPQGTLGLVLVKRKEERWKK